MLVDLISTSSLVSYNVNIANLLGLHEAIYIQEIANISMKAHKKGKFVVESNVEYFTIDREYITSRTTLSQDEQMHIEEALQRIGVLSKHTSMKDTFYFNIEGLAGMLDAKVNNSVVEKVKKITPPKRVSKDEVILSRMRGYVYTKNKELISAYYDWIDAVYSKQGWINKVLVETAQREVDKAADHDLDVALKIIEIATLNGYRDITWAISKLPKSMQKSSSVVEVQRKELGSEVF